MREKNLKYWLRTLLPSLTLPTYEGVTLFQLVSDKRRHIHVYENSMGKVHAKLSRCVLH